MNSNDGGKVTGAAGQNGRGPLGNGAGAVGASGPRPADLVANPSGTRDPSEVGHDFTKDGKGTPGSPGKPRDFADPKSQPQPKLSESSLSEQSIPVGGRLPFNVKTEAENRPTDAPSSGYRPFRGLK